MKESSVRARPELQTISFTAVSLSCQIVLRPDPLDQAIDAAGADILGFNAYGCQRDPVERSCREWTFPVAGRSRIVRPPTRFFVNSAEVAVAATVAGRGIARLLAYQVEREVRAGLLQIVLAGHEPPPIPVHVVHAEGRRATARVRAFIDLAVERLRAETWLS